MAGGGAIYGPFGSLLGSGSSTFHGSRAMFYFGNVDGNSSDGQFYWPHDHQDTADEELKESFQQSERKRRLTAEQLQFLEKNFEAENKLEPERKTQLAKDLGLQSRQVAIWFQNKRARWKTKQLEKDYDALKAKYDNLKGSYESLLKEKEKLKSEVLLLTDKLLKESENNETSKFKSLESHLQTPEVLAENSFSSPKGADVSPIIIKQEDLSSANSTVSDSDSPHCTDGGQCSLLVRSESSTVFGLDQSDSTYAEEKENNLCNTLAPISHYFLKEENDCTELQSHYGNRGVHVEDQSLWFWNY